LNTDSMQAPSAPIAQDFNDIQWINLAMRQDTTGSFALDSAQLAWLEYMAYGGSPVRDYARSLLGLLTGQRFYPEVPEEEAAFRYSADDAILWGEEPGWRIYPVPARDVLQFEWKDYDVDGGIWNVWLTDLMGREMLFDQFSSIAQQHTLVINQLHSGMYIIVITNQTGAVLHSAPVVVHK
jgi:hypothetical protein